MVVKWSVSGSVCLERSVCFGTWRKWQGTDLERWLCVDYVLQAVLDLTMKTVE